MIRMFSAVRPMVRAPTWGVGKCGPRIWYFSESANSKKQTAIWAALADDHVLFCKIYERIQFRRPIIILLHNRRRLRYLVIIRRDVRVDKRREKEGLHFAHITFRIIPSAFSDNDNDNGDDSPPEINLFIGKFNFPGANESDDAGGWVSRPLN